MHETIEASRKAIKETIDLMHAVVAQIERISPVAKFGVHTLCMAPEAHQTANELTRICLDAAKKIGVQTVRPCDELENARKAIHEFGFVTEITDHPNWPESFGGGPNLTLLIATDRQAIDVWLKYNLRPDLDNGREHPFLVGWMLGYPTNSIENFWRIDIDAATMKLRYDSDLEIYKKEFGKRPNDTVGFNWMYELPA